MSEKTFLIALGGATVVLAGALGYWGFSSSKKYDAAKESYDGAVSDIQRLTRGDLYPNPANRQAKEKAVGEYATEVGELQKAFDPYRVAELPAIGVTEFTDKLLANRNEVAAKFEEAGTEVPDQFYLGLNEYTTKPVQSGFAAVLNYQLEAFTELFSELAESEPSALINVHRPKLEEEQGGSPDLEGKTFRLHPIEITFRGSVASVRGFLSRIDDPEKFYYVVRTLRIGNERQTAPNAGDARFEVPKPASSDAGGGSSGFGGGGFDAFFENVGEEEEADAGAEEAVAEEVVEEAPADSGEILKQVLGNEEVNVFLRVDVLQFLQSQE